MPEDFLAAPPSAEAGVLPAHTGLRAVWREDLAIVNLRGDPADAAFVAGAAAALGLALPLAPCTSTADAAMRVIWAGPDEWFVIGAPGQADALTDALRTALADTHHAVTDVSSGYTVLRLSGAATREVLAQGCPIDLHSRAFGPSACAGSLFFKASVWLWRVGSDGDSFELLVRRSFMGYVGLMLQRCTAECGPAVQQLDPEKETA